MQIKSTKFLLLLSFLAILALPYAGRSQNNNSVNMDEAYEGLFNFRYSTLVNTNVFAYVYQDSVYVPLIEILSKLLIFTEYDANRKVLSGYYIKPERKYMLDFAMRKATYMDQEFVIGSGDFIMSKLEIYVLPSLLNRIFNMNIFASFTDMTIFINEMKSTNKDEEVMPILAKFNRSREHDRLIDKEKAISDYPLIFDRNWSFLNGGIADYNINYLQNSLKDRAYSLINNFGFEVLGGDIAANTYLNYSDMLRYSTNFSWRYFISDNPFLSQLKIGTISGTSSFLDMLPSLPSRGVSISNSPSIRTNYFSEYVIEDDLGPGWQVELYVNGELYKYAATNSFGNYRFELPMLYGNITLEQKFYGPKGENYTKSEFIRTPYYLMPPGEFQYHISAGEPYASPTYGKRMYNGKVGMGINSWMTLMGSVTKFDNFKKLDYLGMMNMKVTNELMSLTEVKPDAYIGQSLFGDFGNFGSFMLRYSNFQVFRPSTDTTFNPLNHMLNFSMAFNDLLGYRYVPVNLNLKGFRRQHQTMASNVINIQPNIIFNSIKLSAIYNISFTDNTKLDSIDNITQTIAPILSFGWREKPDWLKFMGYTTFTLSAYYHITNKELMNVRFSIGQALFNKASLMASYSRDMRSGYSRIDAGLMMNLDYFRSSTQATVAGGDLMLSENISGGMGYDAPDGEFYFADQLSGLQVGSSTARLNFFLDDNSDGIYQENEQLIPNVDAKINMGGRRIQNKTTGQSSFVGLMPYARYNILIDGESFPNPLWVANTPKFSFVADPNTTKAMYVPCYSTGVIEGNVVRIDDFGTNEQAGVKVHVMNKDSSFDETIPVFTDGSYYKAGIPPGEYTAWVDSAQVAILNVKSVPEVLAFEVKRTTYGDFVEGLNFELYSQDSYLAKAAEGVRNGNGNGKNGNGNGNGHVPTEDELNTLLAAERQGAAQRKDSKEIATPEPVKTVPEKQPEPGAKPEQKPAQDVKLADAATPEPPKPEPPAVENKTEKRKVEIIANEKKLFTFAKSKDFKLTQEIMDYLDEIAAYLNANPRAELSIVGHSDNFGTMQETQQVSDRRAEEVVNYLVRKGIPKERCLARGDGSRVPMASNTTENGRRLNRRIEITVIE